MEKDLKALCAWLAKDGNSAAELASALGYRTSTTISAWIRRGKIPSHAIARVRGIISK